GSLYNLAQGALGHGTLARVTVAVTRSEFSRLAGLFVPAAAFVAAIPIFGMYLASAGYVFAALALPKRQSVLHAVAIALVTPIALYVVFERLFQVSLPHGALAAAFGF
ncbi:MAG TPA: tripartite tricarboxylate transporter TctB family protein, partial [Bradyrhizobium sp.]